MKQRKRKKESTLWDAAVVFLFTKEGKTIHAPINMP